MTRGNYKENINFYHTYDLQKINTSCKQIKMCTIKTLYNHLQQDRNKPIFYVSVGISLKPQDIV